MALRQLNMQLSEEDMMDLFNFFDKDGGGQCEVKEILAVLKAELTPEESRWQQLGIGKQTLTPTREVHIKVPPKPFHLPHLPCYHLPCYFTTIRHPANPLPPPGLSYGPLLYHVSATRPPSTLH